MVRYLKLLGVAILVAGIYFSWQTNADKKARAARVATLTECFDRRNFDARRPQAPVRAGFFRSLAVLQANLIAESTPQWWRRFRPDASWYLDEALLDLGGSEGEIRLIKTAVLNAYAEARRRGSLTLSGGRKALEAGLEPPTASGVFEGDVLRIGYRLSPALVPEVINHPANFILQPATAWGLQHDWLTEDGAVAAREFHRVGILSEAGWQLAEAYRRDARKND